MFKRELFILINYKTNYSKIEGYYTATVSFNIFKSTKAKAIDETVTRFISHTKNKVEGSFIITQITVL